MKRKLKPQVKKIIQYIFIFGLGAGSVTFFLLGMNVLKDNQKTEQLYIELRSDVKETINEAQSPIDFTKLHQINEDIIAWISIPGTNIDYPVVRGIDNEYYLTHDIYKRKNQNGSIFLNVNNKKDLTDPNIVLFGHNTNSENMFSDLKKIYETKEPKEIILYTENDILKYQITESYLVKKNDDSPYNIQTQTKELTLSTCFNQDSRRIIIKAQFVE